MNEGDLLLRLRSEDSLNLMLTNANDLKYPLYGLKASTPVSLGGLRTRVTLSGRDPAAKDDPYPYRGSAQLDFNRLDMEEFFNGMLDDFRPELPISTYDLLAEITRRTGITFETTDMVNETITRSMSVDYTLRAKQESLRWIGEVTIRLSELQTLETLLDGVGTLTFDSIESPFANLNYRAPFANVTPFFAQDGQALIDGLLEGQSVQNMAAPQRTLMQQLFGFQHAKGGVVAVGTTPSQYNLYNAKIITKNDTTPGLYPNRFNPALNRLMVLELDPAYCTGITERFVYLRYTLFENVVFLINPTPRLFNSGGLSPFNGTAHKTFLQSFGVGDLITSAPNMMLEPSGAAWNAAQARGPRTLYRSVVQYNGLRRAQDNTSIYPGMTHVMTVTINEQWNTQWRGNLHIYYQGD